MSGGLDDDAFTRMLTDRIGRGESITQIVHSLGSRRDFGTCKLRNYCLRLANSAGIWYPKKRLTRKQIRAAIDSVVKDGLTIRAAARKHGISKTSVSRYVKRRREAIAGTAGKTQYEDIVWKCPVHGWVNLRPCVACEALAAKGHS